MYDTMCMTQNMGVIFFENGGVWQKMYDTKIATILLKHVQQSTTLSCALIKLKVYSNYTIFGR